MFCEECGTKLEDGVKFCENCGTPVPMDNTQENQSKAFSDDAPWKNVFYDDNWKSLWENSAKKSTGEIGIILTRSSELCSQLSCSKDDLFAMLDDYVSSAKNRGVSYYLLDLSDNAAGASSSGNVSNVTEILSSVCNVSPFKYLFILGNEDIIEFKVWENLSSDNDENVTSDFVYTVLNETSPWNGVKYDFDKSLRVGRIPTWKGESFSQFSTYFANAKNYIGNFSSIKPYGLSALVWQKESDDEFSVVSNNKVDVSPDVTKHNVEGRIPSDSNLFLFNLHGSNETEFWYGQDGAQYPEAISPLNIQNISSPNFIGVEACYGAIYEKNRNASSSNVVAALNSKTVALLGSSRIAYGTPCPPGSCADVVVGEFIKQIAGGETAGDAHIAGLKQLCRGQMDDSEIKTLCEFALYGDPSSCTGKNKNIVAGKSLVHKAIFGGRSIHIAMPDVRLAVRYSLAEVDSKIKDAINRRVYEMFENMNGIIPETFVDANSKTYQALYRDSKKNIVKVYFDVFGHIKTMISSK